MEKTCSGITRKKDSRYKEERINIQGKRKPGKIIKNWHEWCVKKFLRDNPGYITYEAAERAYYQMGLEEFE